MLETGMPARIVAQMLNVSDSTISRLRTRHQETGDVTDHRRSGRPRVTTENQDRRIVLQHLRDRTRDASTTARETPGRQNNRISSQTIRTRLRNVNIRCRRPYVGPILTAPRRQARLQWAYHHRDWTFNMWSHVLFTDESSFCIHPRDSRRRVYRRRGERFADAAVIERDHYGGAHVMVWAGISMHNRTRLIRVPGILNGQRYRDEILRGVAIPFLEQNPNLTIFQQDNARPHTSRVAMDCLREHHIDTLNWPAYSPDMSPIEHAWDELGRRLRDRAVRPNTGYELFAALEEEWDNIPRDRIRRLVTSMRNRLRACIAARGGHNRY